MTGTRPSVAYVITSTGVGGAERQVYELANKFRSRGWRVGVVSMLPMHHQFLPLEEAGVRLATLGMAKGRPDPRALVRLARLLRAWRPDVVHGHMVHANLLTRLTRLLAPVPRVISTMHNQDEGGQWRYFAYRLTDRMADVTTSVSRVAVAEAVRRHAVHQRRITLVPNGIDAESYRFDAQLRRQARASLQLGERFTWLTVGRLTAAKRHTDLLSAIAIVRRKVPDIQTLIVGDGPLRQALEGEISSGGLASNVSLLGLRDDVRQLMLAADGFVLSSAWEGLPMVLLEAAASSLPIVATDVGGSGDAVLDRETGYLTPPGDPRALADGLLRMMAMTREDRRAMGDRARLHCIESFDLNRVADRWESLYQAR